VKISTEQKGDMVVVRPELPADAPRDLGFGVSFTLQAPARLAVELETSSGSVTASGLEGEAKLHTGNGEVTAKQLRGAVTANTGSGAIDVEALGADAQLESGNG